MDGLRAEKEECRSPPGVQWTRGYVRNLEIDYCDSQGAAIPVEINATVVEKDGEKRILTLCRDISDRKRAESESSSGWRSACDAPRRWKPSGPWPEE